MTMSADGPENYDGYGRLIAEIKRRLDAPRSHPTYLVYFVGSFLFFAALGIWLELLKLVGGSGETDWSPLRTAIATYFPAIFGSVAMQLAISDTLRSLRALGQIFYFIFFLMALILIFFADLPDGVAILVGLLASVVALIWWWIVNADEAALKDDFPPVAAVGGEPLETPLLGDDQLAGFEN